MSTNGLFSWSHFKEPNTSKEIGDTTDTVNRQPTSPEAPSTDSVVTEQPVCDTLSISNELAWLIINLQDSQETMKLRGGGVGEVCCGV
jgi:hypothetical protein